MNNIKYEHFEHRYQAPVDNNKQRRMLERLFLHDIMNSVSPLKFLAELLIQNPNGEKSEEYIQRIHPLTVKLINMIENHKELLQVEHGEITVSRQNFSLETSIRDIIKLFKGNQHIEFFPDQKSSNIITDKTLLERIMVNLLKNAIEASGEGEVISVGFSIDNQRANIWIHNPAHIPERIKANLFLRPISTKGSGRGLGVYSVKLLTEKYLKGYVNFSSSPEGGTKFFLSLPLC